METSTSPKSNESLKKTRWTEKPQSTASAFSPISEHSRSWLKTILEPTEPRPFHPDRIPLAETRTNLEMGLPYVHACFPAHAAQTKAHAAQTKAPDRLRRIARCGGHELTMKLLPNTDKSQGKEGRLFGINSRSGCMRSWKSPAGPPEDCCSNANGTVECYALTI